MHSGYRGSVMEVCGLTVQPPCCLVSDAASDQTAWLDSHIAGYLEGKELVCCDRVPEHPEAMCTCKLVMELV
jgi:hypothetical protein